MSNRKSKKRIFRDSMKENIRSTIHNNKSRKNYLNIVDAFCNYAYENGCRDKESVSVELINSYVVSLQERGLTPSSIHTYVSGICCGLNNPDIKIANITKPKRHVSEYTRTRNVPEEYRWDADPNNPQFWKFVLLAKITGLRRNEIKNLKVGDYRWKGEIDNDFSYLYVRKGKGGKQQLQRLIFRNPEEQVEFEKLFNILDVDGYAFNKTPDDYVLDYETEFKGNSIATHGDLGRKGVAKRAYSYYYNRLMSEPGYREELERQCFEQVERLYKSKDGGLKKIKESRYKGYYYIRGKNREAILKKMQEDKGEHPYINVRLDKLALWAVSLFHLSHARIDVSTHYLLW